MHILRVIAEDRRIPCRADRGVITWDVKKYIGGNSVDLTIISYYDNQVRMMQ